MSEADFMRHVLGSPEPVERCPVTNRIYERGSGALSHAEQSEMFQHEAAIRADMPREGEVCGQTGRPYEMSASRPAWPETRTAQTARFLSELSPDQLAHRRASFEAFKLLEIQGSA
jgi:hypothetical protein